MSSCSVGIDVGGANLKVTDGKRDEIIYFPMWKRWKELKSALLKIKESYKPKKVGVVITAELADSFNSKVDGIAYISSAVEEVFEDCRVFYIDINGEIKSKIDNPRLFAASNWVASVKFLLKSYENFLFADMGSTTTDLIPVTNKIEAGKTDYDRLKRGELLYFGILRTPIFYILPEFNSVPLSSEYFSITADAFILTGDINAEEYKCDTPDGRGKSKEDCARRLVRTLCCDLDEIGYSEVLKLANSIKEEMILKTAKAMKKLSNKYNLNKVIGCGIGEFVLKKASEKASLEYLSLKEKYGDASYLFPAYAVAKLVEQI